MSSATDAASGAGTTHPGAPPPELASALPAGPPAGGWMADRLDVRLRQARLGRLHLEAIAAALAARAKRLDGGGDPAALAARGRAAAEALAASAPGLSACARHLGEQLQRAIAGCEDAMRARPRAALHGGVCLRGVYVDAAGAANLGPERPGAAGDPAEDALRLALEIAAAGQPTLADRLLAAFAEASADYELFRVAPVLEGILALEAALRAVAEAGSEPGARGRALCEARALLRAARGRLAPAAPPQLVAVCGLVATGKSTIARALADALAVPVVCGDRVREMLAARSGDALPADDAVYRELLRCAESVLRAGRSVVVDACFARAAERAALRDLARRCAAPLLFVECRTDPEEVRRRLAARARAQGVSDEVWLALRERVAAIWEPPTELGRAERVRVDGAEPPEDAVARIRAALGRLGRPVASGPHRVRSARAPAGARPVLSDAAG